VKEVSIRGVRSNGMLASEKELDISNNHEQVFLLDEDAPVGEIFSVFYGLDDYILDIENKALTNRPDCFGLIGLVRDISGINKIRFKTPDWYNYGYKESWEFVNNKIESDTHLKIDISLEEKKDVLRYSAVAMDGIKVSESPIRLKIFLAKHGMRPVNNVVDISNYLMLITGQPLHVFDLDKVIQGDRNSTDDKCSIVVRKARAGETLLMINGKIAELDEDIVVIADSMSPLAVAGVMGGKDTEVTEDTKRIIIESATFDLYNIRKTQMKVGVFSEAATRFMRGQDSEQTLPVLDRAITLYSQIAGGKRASDIIDKRNKDREKYEVSFDITDANRIIGKDFKKEEIQKILDYIELKSEINGSKITVQIPSYRKDLRIPEDIYEDISRLYGFGEIPLKLPNRKVAPVKQNRIMNLEFKIREIFESFGGNDLITYNFIGRKLVEKSNLDIEKLYKIKNPLSPELEYMRNSLLPNILDKVKMNVDYGYSQMFLYEINKFHIKDSLNKERLPNEFRCVAGVYV
ncbi:MAG TPA: phenylalanine--tRNA ligase subunit beta, partial [bacterium]|nr:phenylalanine--tRNA ligase subunit beta [bacterium]